MNISGLITIEYTGTDDTAIDNWATTETDDTAFTGEWSELEFVPTTGGFSDTLKHDEAGNLYHETSLQFFVAEPSATQKAELNTLSQQHGVFRVTDPEEVQYIIGNQNRPAKLTYTEQVDPTYTGRRGYAVSVSCENLTGPLFYTDTGSS